MKIGNKDIREKVMIIAEIGNNHEGDFELAKSMIAQAAQAGADAVKFQTIVPDRLVSATQTERITQLSRFQFSYDQFEELSHVAADNGIMFMSTPFDPESARFLNNLVPAFKIASGDNTFYPLIETVALTGKPLLISAGLCDYDQVKDLRDFVYDLWQENGINQELAILHCVSAYPTPPEDANLRAIKSLASLGVTAGYSDHTLGIEAAVMSVGLGARIIEKHFTCDKNHSDFRDHQLSADPSELRELVRRVREAESYLGEEKKSVADCEKAGCNAFRRSIVAANDLPAGTVLSMEHLSWVRPGGGIAPGREGKVLNRCLNRDLGKGEMITLEDLD